MSKTFSLKVRGKVYEVRVKPMFEVMNWTLCWVKVKRVCEEPGYPGQDYFHKTNANIKRAEENFSERNS